jgi:hypothetical protein
MAVQLSEIYQIIEALIVIVGEVTEQPSGANVKSGGATRVAVSRASSGM